MTVKIAKLQNLEHFQRLKTKLNHQAQQLATNLVASGQCNSKTEAIAIVKKEWQLSFREIEAYKERLSINAGPFIQQFVDGYVMFRVFKK
jgi:hypothetical protein